MTHADWRPSASLETLRARARLLAEMRAFFAERGVLEVETPYLSGAGTTDPHIESFTTRFRSPGRSGGRDLYLHTSPEFPMKRLLAAGSGPIYQLARVFRQGEVGRRHNPEFTLLEWYRPGLGLEGMMDEVEALVNTLAGGGAAARVSYGEAFEQVLGLDPHRCPLSRLKAEAEERVGQVRGLVEGDRDAWLALLLTHAVEPTFRGLTFLYDFPASQAALARVRPGEPPIAERFELYWDDLELANGFRELLDAREQGRRFAAERERRLAAGLHDVPADDRLLAAMARGLPECCGVALGVDRLVMRALGLERLDQVLTFPFDRA